MTPKLSRSFLSSIILFSLTLITVSSVYAQKKPKPVINGYVGGYNGRLVNPDAIKAEKLTYINYAFVNCIDSMAVLSNMKTDTANFRLLNTLKKRNPSLQILISIGGWGWSKHFSDAVLTPTSRVLFAKTAVDILRKYNLDGVDIDWEYPNNRGAGNTFRPEDTHNFTLMFVEIRKELNKLASETGKKYLMTAALGASKNFTLNTEMDMVGALLDYAYLMTYDYGGPGGTVGHHTNLYSYGPDGKSSSADQSIKDFIAAGVPASKLGLGVAFYGKPSYAATTNNHGLGEKRGTAPAPVPGARRPPSELGFTYLKDSLIDKKGNVRYWDKQAQAPYLFNETTKQFVTYDDEKSTKLKAKYIKKYHLAGAFFWEYASDPKGYLLDELYKDLN